VASSLSSSSSLVSASSSSSLSPHADATPAAPTNAVDDPDDNGGWSGSAVFFDNVDQGACGMQTPGNCDFNTTNLTESTKPDCTKWWQRSCHC
jgi:hypothetical protein